MPRNKRVGPWRVTRQRGVHARRRCGFVAHAREYVWPSMGIVAFGRWAGLKLLMQANHPHYVALGVALGVGVAFFPILGTHVLIIAVLCALLRASFLGALMGSMLANPWMIGPMWAASFHLGRKVLQMPPASAGAIDHLNALSWAGLVARFGEILQHIIIPTIVGGALIGGPLAVSVYIAVYWWLRRRRAKELA